MEVEGHLGAQRLEPGAGEWTTVHPFRGTAEIAELLLQVELQTNELRVALSEVVAETPRRRLSPLVETREVLMSWRFHCNVDA